MSQQYSLNISSRFNVARALRHYQGKCANIHGHDFRLQVELAVPEPDDNIGLAVDFYEIKALINHITDYLDHRYLNELEPFVSINPTDENIAKWFYQQLCRKIDYPEVSVLSVTLWESDDFNVCIKQIQS